MSEETPDRDSHGDRSTRIGIVRLVTLEAFLMIALGGCAGIALGFGASRYVASLFYQVKATDADMIALPTCAILFTALVATEANWRTMVLSRHFAGGTCERCAPCIEMPFSIP
jgi:ABC-type antimicrobial peptide transport system permease subunit